MTRTINATVGIYDTQYRAVFHKNGHVTVKVPFIEWKNNTGFLIFRTFRVSGNMAENVKKFFNNNTETLQSNYFGGFIRLSQMLIDDLCNITVYEGNNDD